MRAWLKLFAEDHQQLAHKVLDNVIVVSEREIQAGYAEALVRIPGWSFDVAQRTGRWFIVGFGKAGESGPAMVRLFREANNLALEKYDYLFCGVTDLPGLKLTALDTIIFVDDFSGSGRQVCKMWPIFQELIASEAKVHLILTAITTRAEGEIRGKTSLSLEYSLSLGDQHDVFSDANTSFSAEEKEQLLEYGKRADRHAPKGFGKCGLLLVLSHKTPNNSLPILHINEERWRGLFPRYLRAA